MGASRFSPTAIFITKNSAPTPPEIQFSVPSSILPRSRKQYIFRNSRALSSAPLFPTPSTLLLLPRPPLLLLGDAPKREINADYAYLNRTSSWARQEYSSELDSMTFSSLAPRRSGRRSGESLSLSLSRAPGIDLRHAVAIGLSGGHVVAHAWGGGRRWNKKGGGPYYPGLRRRRVVVKGNE